MGSFADVLVVLGHLQSPCTRASDSTRPLSNLLKKVKSGSGSVGHDVLFDGSRPTPMLDSPLVFLDAFNLGVSPWSWIKAGRPRSSKWKHIAKQCAHIFHMTMSVSRNLLTVHEALCVLNNSSTFCLPILVAIMNGRSSFYCPILYCGSCFEAAVRLGALMLIRRRESSTLVLAGLPQRRRRGCAIRSG